MPKITVSCGPSGIISMKSTTWMNWIAARVSNITRSRRGVRGNVSGMACPFGMTRECAQVRGLAQGGCYHRGRSAPHRPGENTIQINDLTPRHRVDAPEFDQALRLQVVR
jgi:hypothetical protein